MKPLSWKQVDAACGAAAGELSAMADKVIDDDALSAFCAL